MDRTRDGRLRTELLHIEDKFSFTLGFAATFQYGETQQKHLHSSHSETLKDSGTQLGKNIPELFRTQHTGNDKASQASQASTPGSLAADLTRRWTGRDNWNGP